MFPLFLQPAKRKASYVVRILLLVMAVAILPIALIGQMRWKTFSSRAGWSINYPASWRTGSCQSCTDLTAPDVYVDFFPPDHEAGSVTIEPLGIQPRSMPPDEWLNNIKRSVNQNPELAEERLTVDDLPALRVRYRNPNDGGFEMEEVYVVASGQTFGIGFSGEIGTPLEASQAYSTYLEMVKMFKAKNFQWNWQDGQELDANSSLRASNLTKDTKKAIVDALTKRIRPMASDLGLPTSEYNNALMGTRIKTIDLNADNVPEVIAQGIVGCSATGNCPFWILRKTNGKYQVILSAEAQTFTIQKIRTNGFREIVLSQHGSYSSGGLTRYNFKNGVYQEVGCYDYEWTVLEGDEVRDLKEPRITSAHCY